MYAIIEMESGFIEVCVICITMNIDAKCPENVSKGEEIMVVVMLIAAEQFNKMLCETVSKLD